VNVLSVAVMRVTVEAPSAPLARISASAWLPLPVNRICGWLSESIALSIPPNQLTFVIRVGDILPLICPKSFSKNLDKSEHLYYESPRLPPVPRRLFLTNLIGRFLKTNHQELTTNSHSFSFVFSRNESQRTAPPKPFSQRIAHRFSNH
jgi:hypothetical protein